MGIGETLHATDGDAFFTGLRRLAASHETSVRTECRFVGVDDSEVWALLSAAVLGGDAGAAPVIILQAENITSRKEAEARLVHQTLHDPLTGLPNRLLLQDRIAHALSRLDRRDESVAVLYLDFDRFKLVNDTFGHDRGDEVLVEIGRRLLAAVRPSDTVARLGGDEFVVVAEGLAGREEASLLADRIRVGLASPLHIDTMDVAPSVSIGIALATEQHGTPDTLLREADTAMYRAKERGKNRH